MRAAGICAARWDAGWIGGDAVPSCYVASLLCPPTADYEGWKLLCRKAARLMPSPRELTRVAARRGGLRSRR